MNNFEGAEWSHIVVKNSKLGHLSKKSKAKNNKNAQRPRRGGLKEYNLSKVFKWTQTAPTACLRILKGKGNKTIRTLSEWTSKLRKVLLNGN